MWVCRVSDEGGVEHKVPETLRLLYSRSDVDWTLRVRWNQELQAPVLVRQSTPPGGPPLLSPLLGN